MIVGLTASFSLIVGGLVVRKWTERERVAGGAQIVVCEGVIGVDGLIAIGRPLIKCSSRA